MFLAFCKYYRIRSTLSTVEVLILLLLFAIASGSMIQLHLQLKSRV